METIQSLRMAPEVFDYFLSGNKKVTIRKGRKDIKLGLVKIECISGERVGSAIVHQVLYTSLLDVPVEDLRFDGFSDKVDMYEGLKKFYPDLKWRDEVTVIRFK